MSDQPAQEESVESGQTQSVHLLESEPEGRQSTGKSEEESERSIFTEQRERVEELRERRRTGNIAICPRVHQALEAKVWDANPWLLGALPGAIDLRTGTLRTGRPNDYVRTVIPTAWKGLDRPAPRFGQFLREIFADREESEREELIAFLQRTLGYGLTGYVKEHVFLLFSSAEDDSGREMFIHILRHVLGNMVGEISQEFLLTGKRSSTPENEQPFLSALQGKRIVWVREPPQGARFSSEQIKFLTSGEQIAIRQGYGRAFTFPPSHLLILLSKQQPEVDPTDRIFWERICSIPFNLRFVSQPERANERLRDARLRRALEAEASGILAWLVRGVLDWQRYGLTIPSCVLRSRQGYRGVEGAASDFVRDCCALHLDAQMPASLLYKSYRAWVDENGLTPTLAEEFARQVEQIEGVTWLHRKQGKVYKGIGLRKSDSKQTQGACGPGSSS